MTIYYFDDGKADGACKAYLAGVHNAHRADHQADVDGFWRVLRSEAGRNKLAVAPAPTKHGIKGPTEPPPKPLTPLDEEDLRDG